MIINSQEKFLQKAYEQGNIDAAIELYKKWSDQTDDVTFHKAGKLYTELLAKFSPIDAIRIINHAEDVALLTIDQIHIEYLYAILVSARYNIGHANPSGCVHWAKKGLEIISKLYPKQTRFDDRLLNYSYKNLNDLFIEYERFFNQQIYAREFSFIWEADYFDSLSN